jgi:hypothetical protein
MIAISACSASQAARFELADIRKSFSEALATKGTEDPKQAD